MDVTSLTFPVLAFDRYVVAAFCGEIDLTTTWTPLLRSGYFRNLELVDSTGQLLRVLDARPLHGVGPLWGYKPLVGRRVRIELELSTETRIVSAEELKKRIRTLLESWEGWKSRDDYESVLARVEQAQSVSELVSLVEGARL